MYVIICGQQNSTLTIWLGIRRGEKQIQGRRYEGNILEEKGYGRTRISIWF